MDNSALSDVHKAIRSEIGEALNGAFLAAVQLGELCRLMSKLYGIQLVNWGDHFTVYSADHEMQKDYLLFSEAIMACFEYIAEHGKLEKAD